jgi:tight adherence protein B
MSVRRPTSLVIIGLAAAVAVAIFGVGVGFAVLICALTARSRWRARRQAVDELAAVGSTAEAIHGVVAELRAGAHPVAAVESSARDAAEPARTVLTAVASTARFGGEPATTITRFAGERPELGPALRPLAHAWSLAHRHGLPLADLLAAVHQDVAGRVRFAGTVRARMAGPRASGTVLAALPLLGVLLGEAMGAGPLHVLFATSVGQVLLAIGTFLACVGTWWIDRLTSGAVPT